MREIIIILAALVTLVVAIFTAGVSREKTSAELYQDNWRAGIYGDELADWGEE